MSPNLYTAFFRPPSPSPSHVCFQDEEPPEAGARHVVHDSSSPPDTHRRILKKHPHDHSYDHDRTRSESTISFPRPPSAAKEQPRASSSKVRSLMDRLRSASLSITWAENEHKAARPSGPSGLQQAFRSAWKRAVALSGRYTPNSNREARGGPTVIRTPMEAFADDASLAATLTIPPPMGRARSQSESAPRTTVFPTNDQTTGLPLKTSNGPTIVRTAEEAFSPEQSDPTSQAPASKRPGVRLKRSLTLPPLRITARTAKSAAPAEPLASLPARTVDRAVRQPRTGPAASRKSMAPARPKRKLRRAKPPRLVNRPRGGLTCLPSPLVNLWRLHQDHVQPLPPDSERQTLVLGEVQKPNRAELQRRDLVELWNHVQVELQKSNRRVIGRDKRAFLQRYPQLLLYRWLQRGARV
ncbi:hypothetical protein EV714DRAFT_268366 [Schizophyllum commune]